MSPQSHGRVAWWDQIVPLVRATMVSITGFAAPGDIFSMGGIS
jgi:hypothetical protein